MKETKAQLVSMNKEMAKKLNHTLDKLAMVQREYDPVEFAARAKSIAELEERLKHHDSTCAELREVKGRHGLREVAWGNELKNKADEIEKLESDIAELHTKESIYKRLIADMPNMLYAAYYKK